MNIKNNKENLYSLINRISKKHNKEKGGILIFESCLIINYFSTIINDNLDFIKNLKSIVNKYDKHFINKDRWNEIKKYMNFENI